uniref:Uncharacterized protein AlNc14C7G956 n=1 Tax=Albugo laibachii Nc14 TaxID=890382 RepID=F0W1I8_9STRA|nr:conserved hypothetical protein [Albugo laibachii Nc14]|eukprot:CCA14917.1 conserved hypothetical protein [Albugo laibachii Nc14]
MATITSLQVDNEQLYAMNLQVLKRHDESMTNIIDMSSHVAVYEFDQVNQSWKRNDTEGCLFIVERLASPRYQLIVNNRLNTKNMILDIDHSLHVDCIESFLILRVQDKINTSTFTIYGVWFFPERDRNKIFKILERIQKTIETRPIPSEPPQPPTSTQYNSTTISNTGSEKRKPSSKRIQQSNARQQVKDVNVGSQKGNKKSVLSNQQKSIAILQRPQQPSNVLTQAEGKAAGELILGMISSDQHAVKPAPATHATQDNPNSSASLLLPTSILTNSTSRSSTNKNSGTREPKQTSKSTNQANDARISKADLKETLVFLLDEPSFLETIYQAYLHRVSQSTA